MATFQRYCSVEIGTKKMTRILPETLEETDMLKIFIDEKDLTDASRTEMKFSKLISMERKIFTMMKKRD